VKHGDGKKWYLNAHNYSKELARKKKIDNYDHLDWLYRLDLVNLGLKSSLTRPVLNQFIKYYTSNIRAGQVVPFDDLGEILEIAENMRFFECICEKMTHGSGKNICLMLGPKSDRMNRIGKQKSEIVSKDDVINKLRELNDRGMIHSLWTYGVPFIGAICTCDDKSCLGILPHKKLRDYGVNQLMSKSEYLYSINEKRCSGCGLCSERCMFDAIEFNEQGKARIIRENCVGCGSCVLVCNRNAISRDERNSIPDFKGKW